jgi:hypothetical protein
MTAADILRQGLEQHNSSTRSTSNRSQGSGHADDGANWWGGWWDAERTARMTSWGLTAHPIVIHYWMITMERWQGTLALSAPKWSIVKLAARYVRSLCCAGVLPRLIAPVLA